MASFTTHTLSNATNQIKPVAYSTRPWCVRVLGTRLLLRRVCNRAPYKVRGKTPPPPPPKVNSLEGEGGAFATISYYSGVFHLASIRQRLYLSGRTRNLKSKYLFVDASRPRVHRRRGDPKGVVVMLTHDQGQQCFLP